MCGNQCFLFQLQVPPEFINHVLSLSVTLSPSVSCFSKMLNWLIWLFVQAFIEMNTEEAANTMVNYYTTVTPVLRSQPIYIQFSNHKELKTDNSPNQAVSSSLPCAGGRGGQFSADDFAAGFQKLVLTMKVLKSMLISCESVDINASHLGSNRLLSAWVLLIASFPLLVVFHLLLWLLAQACSSWNKVSNNSFCPKSQQTVKWAAKTALMLGRTCIGNMRSWGSV